MQKKFGQNIKALSSLALILLLLIFAIIGGLISYLWVMGYYMSLKEKIPEENLVTITNLVFPPQNATTFNVTVLNPSYSPDTVQVERIAISEKTEGIEGKLSYVTTSIPKLPYPISRGQSETFICRGDWSPYVDKTIIVSVFVKDGSGSTRTMKLPYVKLHIEKVDFNPVLGIKNFTVTLRNDNRSVTHLDVSEIALSGFGAINSTTPSLPYTLNVNESVTITCNFNWSTYATGGGSQTISVKTRQGYAEAAGAEIPRVTFEVEEINFNPADTTHFKVSVKNKVSLEGAYLNVTNIIITMQNGTEKDVTPSLNSSTNGVPWDQTATFTCEWDWTNYRNKNVLVGVKMLQGITPQYGRRLTPFAALLNITETPIFPDTNHFFVKVKNSDYSVKVANVTKIEIELDDGTDIEVPIEQPLTRPYLIGVGNVTMFSCYWNWTNYLNRSINIIIYTDEGVAAFHLGVKTNATISGFQIYLTIPLAPNFNTANTTRFDVKVRNSNSSLQDATITRITVLLENGTEIDAICISHALPWTLIKNSTETFTCEWDWTNYRNKNVIICIYTDNGLKTFYITKTPP